MFQKEYPIALRAKSEAARLSFETIQAHWSPQTNAYLLGKTTDVES